MHFKAFYGRNFSAIDSRNLYSSEEQTLLNPRSGPGEFSLLDTRSISSALLAPRAGLSPSAAHS